MAMVSGAPLSAFGARMTGGDAGEPSRSNRPRRGGDRAGAEAGANRIDGSVAGLGAGAAAPDSRPMEPDLAATCGAPAPAPRSMARLPPLLSRFSLGPSLFFFSLT